MTKFLVRVVLHDVGDDRTNYEQLHEAMERVGFSRVIESSPGFVYDLPTASTGLSL